MKHLNFELPGSYEFYFWPDVHERRVGFSTKALNKLVRLIKSGKNNYWGGGGDNIEAIAPFDKRYKIGTDQPHAQRVDQQINLYIKDHESIADRCLYILDGNHDRKLVDITDAGKRIWESFGLPIPLGEDELAPYMVKVDINGLRFIHWHGSGFVNSRAGDAHQRYNNDCISIKRKLRDLGGVSDCQVAVMNHIHKIRIHPPTCSKNLVTVSHNNQMRTYYPAPIQKDLGNGDYYYHDDDRWYASSGAIFGSYLEGTVTYVEERGFRPTDMGCVKMVIKNDNLVGLEEVVL